MLPFAMSKRATGAFALAGLLATTFAFGSALLVAAQAPAPRTAFVIATGPTGGTYFPVGEAIASIVSHPPGVDRCEKPGVCGPEGLIASVRTSAGAVANVLSVNAHTVDAALAQSDVIADAWAGRGVFRRDGTQSHVRAIAVLFPEELHLVAAKSAHIRSVADLAGKRVSIGAVDSGTSVTVRAVLAGFRLSAHRLKASGNPSDVAAEKLAKGGLDAMFFVGGAPVPLVRELLQSGRFELVPMAGSGRDRLLAHSPALTAATLPAGLYPGTGRIDTVAVRAIFIVNDSVPNATVYGVVKSLFNPANRSMLAGSHRSAEDIALARAAQALPVPLQRGAERFYVETGKLPKPAPVKLGKT